MQLSEHFSLAEFTASDTARARHIANEPNARQIESMKALCANVLEPLRSHFGKPVRITSGFRTPELCLAVGSSTGSQHAKGEAADFEVTGVSNLAVAQWIRDCLTFDQLIDRKSVVEGKSVSGRVVLGGRRSIKKKKMNT